VSNLIFIWLMYHRFVLKNLKNFAPAIIIRPNF